MHAIGQWLKLRPGCYEEYKRRHDELWPELAEMMHQLGIDMVIYRFEDSLFVYGVAPSEDAWAAAERHPLTPRWNAYMADVLETDAQGVLVVAPLECAFSFGAFAQK